MSKFVGIREAARIIGISRQGVHFAIKTGKLKAIMNQYGDYGVYAISMADVQRFKRQRRCPK